MKTHADEVIAERTGVYAVVEALEPASGLRVIVNLVFGSTAFSLISPVLVETILGKNLIVILRPFPERLPTGLVDKTESAQLSELLRELRDFR